MISTTAILRVILLVVVILGASPCSAHTDEPWVSLLHEKKYSLLETKTREHQTRFEAGTETEFALQDAYSSLFDIGVDDLPLLDEWRNQHPKSYAVRLIRGTYYGRAFRALTNSGRYSELPALYALTTAELQSSLKLTEKPYLSVLHLLDAESDSPLARKELLITGTSMLASNTLLRSQYLRGLSPSRDGSMEAMYRFMAEAGKDGATKSSLMALQAVIHDEMGEYSLKHGNEKLAIENFSTALELSSKLGFEGPQTAIHALRNSCRIPALNSYCDQQSMCTAGTGSICKARAKDGDYQCLNFGAIALGSWHDLDICLRHRDEIREPVLSLRETVSKAYPSLRRSIDSGSGLSMAMKEITSWRPYVFEDGGNSEMLSNICKSATVVLGRFASEPQWHSVLSCWK